MKENSRILIVDDDPGIRDSYKSILCPSHTDNVLSRGASLFDEPVEDSGSISQNQYDLILTDRGEEGIKAVEKAVEQESPFATAFIDMKMPGIDGAETAKGIWAVDSRIKFVIVTAHSEYTPEDTIRITDRDNLFFLRKPFNPEEIRQFARVLTHEWFLEREKELLNHELKKTNEELETRVEQRTAELRQVYERIKLLEEIDTVERVEITR